MNSRPRRGSARQPSYRPRPIGVAANPDDIGLQANLAPLPLDCRLYRLPHHGVCAEAAMIVEYKPLENNEYKSNFPFEKTTIAASGKNGLLNEEFTAEKIN